ncbi:MAG: S8 family serine peptidase, partial [Chloroflexota bacterium]
MKRQSLITMSLVMGLCFVALVALTVGLSQASGRANLPTTTEDFFYGQWQDAPANSPFAYTRIDAEYSLETGLIYVLGGRLADNNTTGRVWSFDPVSGVYTDTGVDMPTPVSNYSIARLEESDGDEVLVIFGGRPAAGGVTNVVQGYYPATNTTTTFTTDPYPVSTSPGNAMVVDNVAYVFGGFDAVVVIDDTYIFDITAPAGSRWTTGPNLNRARSYIPAAVVDGVIYAMGGDDFVAAALIPLTVTEKLDTNLPTPVWDDAGTADLPIACDEAPAFGFDTNSGYDLAGAIVMGGCGQWSSEIAESQLYDTDSDTWDTSFPDLLNARRNHAGAFVPTGDKDDNGVPGMWIFGGRQGSDSNVLTEVEFYSVTPLSDFTLLPRSQTVIGAGTVEVVLGASNLSGGDETFDLEYVGSQTWPISGPDSVFVPDGETEGFSFEVEVPPGATCQDVDDVTVTGAGQGDPSLTDTVDVRVQGSCEATIVGTVTDANTGLGIPDAYVYMEVITDTTIVLDAFTDENGQYTFEAIQPRDYQMAVSAEGYAFSLGAGDDWIYLPPLGPGSYVTQDVTLDAPVMEWSADSYDVTLEPGQQMTYTLTITNSGTSTLTFALGSYSEGVDPLGRVQLPDRPRIDPRLLSDLEAAADGQADFIVVMAEQADLSAAYAISDWNARGQYVYDTLKATADRTQAAIRALLESQGVAYRPFLTSNSLLANGDMELINTIAARADVAFLLANASVPLERNLPELMLPTTSFVPSTIEWGVARVNADDVWTTYGTRGEGIVVANVDTGVEYTHDALERQYRGAGGDHDYNWYHPTSPEGCDGSAAPCDNDGHGTHTMGTMVGEDVSLTNQVGVAPGATWTACKGCEFNSCSFEALLACGDWIAAPTDLDGLNPDPSQRPNIVNNSWGGSGGDFWYANVVSAWRAAGIWPQFSGGNSGPQCSTSGSPGDYDLSFSAAAVDISDLAAGFSGRGPATNTGILKPNVSGPGVNVRSSYVGNGYALLSGTSMASPHVAGVVALLWSERPELIGQIEDTMWVMEQAADPLYTTDTCGGDDPTSHPNHTYGWGMADALAAIGLAESTEVVVPWLEIIPSGGTLAPGESMEVQLVFTAPDDLGTYTGTLQLTANEPYNPDVRLP